MSAATPSYALRDSLTMFRRHLLHARRYPAMTVSSIGMPIIMLLLFNYVFGGSISSGMGAMAGAGSDADYIDYVVPGILLMTLGASMAPTTVGVSSDMTQGIVDRFRTMAISRSSVLTGRVVGSVLQTLVSVVLVVGVALLMGFRSGATPVEWLAAAGLVALMALALTWLAVALGLNARTPEGANSSALPFSFLLPFISSAFVPLDSLPDWLRWFAEYQPFTAVIETLRGLLLGDEIGTYGWLALGWGAGLALLGHLWARAQFNRDVSR